MITNICIYEGCYHGFVMNYEIGCHIEKKMTGDIESEGYAVLENLKEIALFNTLRFLK